MSVRAAASAAALAVLLGASVALAADAPAPALTSLECTDGPGAPPSACPGAAVVHPPPASAKATGYVDCVSPGSVTDARCVAGAAGGGLQAASVDGGFGGFPPAHTAAVLAACPDTPLLPDGVDTAAGDLPSQDVLDAAAGQISACVSALRADPDALACYYPCDYGAWRAAALSPPRGGLATEGPGPAALAAAAARHASDMASSNAFAHAGSDNSSVASRIADAGFATFPLGENIAAGYASVRAVSLAWACSAGHRANLLACGFDSLGTGVAVRAGSTYTIYYSQEFGCSRPDYDCTCPPGPVEVDPATLPPLPPCPDSPAWTPAPAAGGGALIGSTPAATRAAADAAGAEDVGAGTPPPPDTPTPEPTALFAEGTPLPTETEAAVEEEEAVDGGAARTPPTPPPSATPRPPPPDTLPPPSPRSPPPPCPPAASQAAGCLFAVGPGLLARRGGGRGTTGSAADAEGGGGVLVAWSPSCAWAGGGASPAAGAPALAATLTPSNASDPVVAATVTPMGPLPGRPGTLLASVETPPGWSGTVTVRAGGGTDALSYGVGPPSSVPARRAPVQVTGVGLVGAVTVDAPGE